ncbi:hypothetical protein Thiowin_01598 [Thiorhodovibrio winogradskyi]|uniref:DUF3540 domain-containing protein n=1 Tax=Thiorhodovibrio winogradskyi TaxID=77007 RepID=A0ABZ0S969_9GAMM|nr:DUF3540 domain-containing protein [Thiorhodovibrio winogradskyi]
MHSATTTAQDRASGAPDKAGADMRMVRCRLLAAGEDLAVADTPLGILSCRPAASCLLRPEPGDWALVALPEGSKADAWVLAVLERGDSDAPAMLDLPSGAHLQAPHGALSLEASQGISLATPAEFSASAVRMSFAADKVSWLARSFSFLGQALEFVTRRFTETAEERDTQAKTWTQRLGDSFRHVEELDETQAGMVRTLARDTALLHGRVTYIQAEEFVKADGQEVHLG